MELWEIAAHVEIRNLIAAYNANGDSGRFEEMMQVFAPDGVLEAGGGRHEGREAIAAFLTGIVERAPATGAPDRRTSVRHFTATTKIDVLSPQRATAYSYYQVLTRHGLDHWGRYFDEFTVVDGAWRIARRRATTDAAIEGGWGADRTQPSATQEHTA
jgi:uncharacterized protein (TIGR02246 family)